MRKMLMEKVLFMEDLNLTGKTWIAVLEVEKFKNVGVENQF